MKVSELSGVLLDYWVARAEGIEHPPTIRKMTPGRVLVPYEQESNDGGRVTAFRDFRPSTSWADGGPIIERERITVAWQPMKGKWMAGLIETENGSMLEFRWLGFDASPLVAAMRAYVSSKFGDEVTEA
jgi:hypothetical protein